MCVIFDNQRNQNVRVWVNHNFDLIHRKEWYLYEFYIWRYCICECGLIFEMNLYFDTIFRLVPL
jgi:hypothetical protein